MYEPLDPPVIANRDSSALIRQKCIARGKNRSKIRNSATCRRDTAPYCLRYISSALALSSTADHRTASPPGGSAAVRTATGAVTGPGPLPLASPPPAATARAAAGWRKKVSTSSTRLVLSARSTSRPRRPKCQASPCDIVASATPVISWLARFTSSRNSRACGQPPYRREAACTSRWALLISSHIAELIMSRTVRAFSRAALRQLAIELGLAGSKARNEITLAWSAWPWRSRKSAWSPKVQTSAFHSRPWLIVPSRARSKAVSTARATFSARSIWRFIQ